MDYRTLIKQISRTLPSEITPTLKSYLFSTLRVNLPIFQTSLTPNQQHILLANLISMLTKVYGQPTKLSNPIQQNSDLYLSYVKHRLFEVDMKELDLSQDELIAYKCYSRLQFFYLLAVNRVFPKQYVGPGQYYWMNLEQKGQCWQLWQYPVGNNKVIELYAPISVQKQAKNKKMRKGKANK